MAIIHPLMKHLASMARRSPLRRRLPALAAMLIWIGLVLYPNPVPLWQSLDRLAHPPVDPAAAETLAAQLPDDPVLIDAFSRDYIRYDSAWRIYGMPWYFPSVAEAIADRAGDCQAQALVAASIFEAKGIPYTLNYSFDHVWVDYEGKQYTSLEDPAQSLVASEGTGWLARMPSRLPLADIVEQRVRFHWLPMPLERKLLLGLGVMVILFWAESLPQALRVRISGTRAAQAWRG